MRLFKINIFVSLLFYATITSAQSFNLIATKAIVYPNEPIKNNGVTCIGPQLKNLSCTYSVSNYKKYGFSASYTVTLIGSTYNIGTEFKYVILYNGLLPKYKNVPTSSLSLNGLDFDHSGLANFSYYVNGKFQGVRPLDLRNNASVEIELLPAIADEVKANPSALTFTLNRSDFNWTNLNNFCSQIQNIAEKEEKQLNQNNGAKKTEQKPNEKKQDNFWDDEKTNQNTNNTSTQNKTSKQVSADDQYNEKRKEADEAAKSGNYTAAKNAMLQANKIKPNERTTKEIEALEMLERYKQTGSTLDKDKLLRDQAMDGADLSTSNGSLETFAKGLGTSLATGNINAGLIAGGAGLLIHGSNNARIAREKREAEEAERKEKERLVKLEKERREALHNNFLANLKNSPCPTAATAGNNSEAYAYYILKNGDTFIFSSVFTITKSDDDSWPYCSDIEKKFRTEAKKKYPSINDNSTLFLNITYQSFITAQSNAQNQYTSAKNSYWLAELCNFTLQKKQSPSKSTNKPDSKKSFWED